MAMSPAAVVFNSRITCLFQKRGVYEKLACINNFCLAGGPCFSSSFLSVPKHARGEQACVSRVLEENGKSGNSE